ncbi:hypothetical protein ABMA28_017425, partial [Loxostege sticticalis]
MPQQCCRDTTGPHTISISLYEITFRARQQCRGSYVAAALLRISVALPPRQTSITTVVVTRLPLQQEYLRCDVKQSDTAALVRINAAGSTAGQRLSGSTAATALLLVA